MAVFPTDVYPVAESWFEEITHPVELIKTRNTIAAFRSGQRLRWKGSGEIDLSGDLQNKFYDFLAATNNGLDPFSITTFLNHHQQYVLSSPNVAQLSRHRYDSIPITSSWHIGYENLLPSSENLGDTTNWTAQGGATVTRTGSQTAPDGSATAWRIQTSGGSSTEKLDNIGYGGTYLPIGWRWYLGLWVRNLSISKSVQVLFRGLGVLATVPAQTPWTFYSGVVTPGVSFQPGIRFNALSASDSLDFVVWRPQIIAFQPDGSDVPSAAIGDALGYVPTPTGSYIRGDSNGRGHVWRDSSGATTGVVNGRLFIENALLTSSSNVLSIQKKFLTPDWVSINVNIEEV